MCFGCYEDDDAPCPCSRTRLEMWRATSGGAGGPSTHLGEGAARGGAPSACPFPLPPGSYSRGVIRSVRGGRLHRTGLNGAGRKDALCVQVLSV